MSDTPVILISFGSAGDLYPFIGLARAFQDHGREVLLLCSGIHEQALAGAGVPWRSVGDPERYRRALADPDLWHPRRGIRVLLRDFAEHLEILRGLLLELLPADRPTLVLSHPFGLPAIDLLRRERPLLRAAGVHLAPASLRSIGDPMVWGPFVVPRGFGPDIRRWLWTLSDERVVDPYGLPQINALRAAHALPPVTHFLPHLAEPADFTVTLFPPWFAPTQGDWHGPVVEGDFALVDPHEPVLPAALQDFLAAGDAPLVFTPGSANFHAARLFDNALAAVQALGRRAVFLTPQRAQVPAALPPQVLWLPYVPLGALLPHAALLLHHGGIGTLAQALRAGVPQMVVPFGWDQFDNACRLRRLGVARSCPAYRLNRWTLRRHLAHLLDDASVRSACAKVAVRLSGRPARSGHGFAGLAERIEAQADQSVRLRASGGLRAK